ncbi:hypothetical protein KDX30_15525 [Pseudomonas sp. CDFA 553]|uniref:hypothetical protein n=1 Tax=Pseudomonas quasicaspiana TaxID=2829821 RepID=UPI001E4DB6F7|nr:hypothetical protein [Pseudomonas quasicaspiana]MCD5989312.1 hypothetical protein [Pseudomonas quasicaspiana]
MISVEEGFKPAKVLYVLQRYKGVILLGVYKKSVTLQQLPDQLPDTFEVLIYTSKAPIQKQRWRYVGHEDLRSTQENLDHRVVAGELWQGNNHLGSASVEDKKKLPEMLVMGAGLVEKKASAIT